MPMAVELQVLAWSVLLGLAHVLIGAQLSTMQKGIKWNVSPRDDDTPPTGVAGRVDRALKNYLETYAFFAAAVLALVVTERTDATTALAAQAYLAARVLYVPLYAAGIPYIRSLVWLVGFGATAVLAVKLLSG
jgi:uncharacterized MAPEG superfamily protein